MEKVDGDIWVVDNHSVDGSVDMVRNKFPNVHCIANESNPGFSVANNQAIRQSTAEYVLLLNPDTVVQEDTFTKCIEYLDAHPDVGGLGVKMIDGKGKFLPESKRGLPTPEVAFYKMAGLNKVFPKSKRFGKYHLGYIGENETADVDVLAGAFMMMRKSTLDKVGLLDESFFMYGEDIDLSYRITKGGFKNVYFPETSIIHYKGESTKRMSVNYVFVFYRAMIIFAKKHYTGNAVNLFVGLINLSIYLRAFLAIIQRFFIKSWLYLIDAILIPLGLLAVHNYWEGHIVDFEGYFSPIYAQTHFPAYTAIWLLLVFWSGGYQKPYTVNKVLRGVIAGTIMISALYAFLPKSFQFSKGIILAGTVTTAVVMILTRLIAHFVEFKNFRIGKVNNRNTVIVGHKSERERVLGLIQKSESKIQFLGFVSMDDENSNDVLGSVNRLDDLCDLYKIDEVIFCSKDVSSSATMQWMAALASSPVSFKIVPDASGFIIGSNAKDLNGELYTEEIRFNLSDNNNRQKKRLVDVLISGVLLIFGIFVAWFTKGFVWYFQSVFSTLLGKKTWVSYDTAVDTGNLPVLKSGVFTVSDENRGIEQNDLIRSRLNYFYAKNYSIESDLRIVLRSLFS